MRPPLGAGATAPRRFAVGALVLASAVVTASLGPSGSIVVDATPLLFVEVLLTGLGAFVAGGLAVWVRSRRLAVALLVALAVAGLLAKAVVAMLVVSMAEPDPWAMRTTALGMWVLADVPLALSWLPALSAARRAHAATPDARGDAAGRAPAWDAAIAANVVTAAWLALVCGGLWPGAGWWVGRAACAAGVLAAAGLVAAAALSEARLARWLRDVHAGEVPGIWAATGAEATAGALPPVYDADPGNAVLVQAEGPTPLRRPHGGAAFATAPLAPPPGPRVRVAQRLGQPLGFALAGWLFLGSFVFLTAGMEARTLPPRALTWRYDHYRVEPFAEYTLEGLSLWKVEQGAGLVVGWDGARGEVVAGEALFRRSRGLSPAALAERANQMMMHSVCCVVREAPGGGPRVLPDAGVGVTEPEGAEIRAPFVEGGTLVFWRTDSGEPHGAHPYRFTFPVTPEMVAR